MAKRVVDKAAPKAATVLKRELVKAPNFFSLYSNDVQVQVSPFDVRLVFGELSPSRIGESVSGVIVTQLAEVTVSPQWAKRLLQVIGAQLGEYEQKFGPIPSEKRG